MLRSSMSWHFGAPSPLALPHPAPTHQHHTHSNRDRKSLWHHKFQPSPTVRLPLISHVYTAALAGRPRTPAVISTFHMCVRASGPTGSPPTCSPHCPSYRSNHPTCAPTDFPAMRNHIVRPTDRATQQCARANTDFFRRAAPSTDARTVPSPSCPLGPI